MSAETGCGYLVPPQQPHRSALHPPPRQSPRAGSRSLCRSILLTSQSACSIAHRVPDPGVPGRTHSFMREAGDRGGSRHCPSTAILGVQASYTISPRAYALQTPPFPAASLLLCLVPHSVVEFVGPWLPASEALLMLHNKVRGLMGELRGHP